MCQPQAILVCVLSLLLSVSSSASSRRNVALALFHQTVNLSWWGKTFIWSSNGCPSCPPPAPDFWSNSETSKLYNKMLRFKLLVGGALSRWNGRTVMHCWGAHFFLNSLLPGLRCLGYQMCARLFVSDWFLVFLHQVPDNERHCFAFPCHSTCSRNWTHSLGNQSCCQVQLQGSASCTKDRGMGNVCVGSAEAWLLFVLKFCYQHDRVLSLNDFIQMLMTFTEWSAGDGVQYLPGGEVERVTMWQTGILLQLWVSRLRADRQAYKRQTIGPSLWNSELQ